MAMYQYTMLILFLAPLSSSFKTYSVLNKGQSLSSPDDVLLSPSNIFTAGFYKVGENAYSLAIWFSRGPPTPVWMANRDEPVNGRNTKLSLLHSGNLVLEDTGLRRVWTSASDSSATVAALQLRDDGNLVLRCTENGTIIWQSFDSPTNTILPRQPLTQRASLTSSRSETNHSSGFYQLFFDDDNVLRLIFAGAKITSVFWPGPWMVSWEAGRTTYNTTKTAMLDLYGCFTSSDQFEFRTSDYGIGPQRRMTLDHDGLIRVYTFNDARSIWEVSWQLDLDPCSIHGLCGANSLCSYSHDLGRRCLCLPGYKTKNDKDWSEGCVPDFHRIPCKKNGSHENTASFLKISNAEFYGYDIGFFQNMTLQECESLCLSLCTCKAFQFNLEGEIGRLHNCYPKFLLLNGRQTLGFNYSTYIRLPNSLMSALNKNMEPIESQLHCTDSVVELERTYIRPKKYAWLRPFVWFVGVVGVVEVVCVFLFLYKTRESSSKLREKAGFEQIGIRSRRFAYSELKKASCNFSQEIGRGGSGTVYKGVLPDNRIAAIKCLNDASQGEAEFLAEVSLIGRLNHANLLETWGYCAEGKHRILVYEYMGNGSLADILSSHKHDSKMRFDIALGTAKALAYLHEECLEWVLHCDIKPHNILLDVNYQPKVADFGLSKRVKRSGIDNLNVSAIRGTRGYMAPEWIYNLPITAKVDVYSYGIVVLEMVTGKSPNEMNFDVGNGDVLETNGEIDEYDDKGEEYLVKVALQCAQENRYARPTIKQVVDMLLLY